MSQVIDINTQELKEHAPLIQYIKQYYGDKIVIERETDTIAVAKCVFHQEDTGSLVFYANGTYKCFGCGEHGDVITFVQKMEGVDFQTACIMIANNVGYQLQYTEENPAWKAYKDELDNHTRRYWRNLQNNVEALNYLINTRGISPQMIDEFRLGLTDSQEFRYRNDMSNICNKIVFPILEHRRIHPQCVGMAYRAIVNEDPKYINDRNQSGLQGQNEALSGIFVKGNMLYGLAQAYKAISDRKFVFIVEGYFDVISMHQSGLRNTVGVMGTSFTEAQLKTIQGLTSNVFILLDNDNAGKKAASRMVASLLQYNIRPVVSFIQGYKDPDEICKALNYDGNRISMLLNHNAEDGMHHIITEATESYRKMMSLQRMKIYQEVGEIIDKVPNPYMRQAYTNELIKELQ